jgi:oligogalacturonide lyase
MKGILALVLAAASVASAASAGPPEWIDTHTGHRIVRITDEPGASSLYFNERAFTPQGDKLAISSDRGILAVDLKSWAVSPVVEGKNLQLLFTGGRSRNVYYSVAAPGASPGEGPRQIWVADIDTGKAHKVADVAAGSVAALNADETLLAGTVAARSMPLQPGSGRRDPRFGQANYEARGKDGKPLTFAEAKEVRLNDRLEAKIPMEIFTIDLRTGERRTVIKSTDWLNHLLFSPTDPTLLMFCHEGPWHKVDRIWTVRTDGSHLTKIHTRTMNMEIAGHEFWAPDGKTIWYDLQTPRGEVFWLAGYDLATGHRRYYSVDRNEWSVHYNVSPDQKWFAGDGGDAEMVAHAPDGKYLYLFTPRAIPDVAGIHAPGADSLIDPGTFDSEKLVDMAKHDYRLEPNVHFTPDGKWLVFRSNMEGHNGVYAVELAKAAAR